MNNDNTVQTPATDSASPLTNITSWAGTTGHILSPSYYSRRAEPDHAKEFYSLLPAGAPFQSQHLLSHVVYEFMIIKTIHRVGRAYLHRLEQDLHSLVEFLQDPPIGTVSKFDLIAAIHRSPSKIPWTKRRRRASYETFFRWAQCRGFLGSHNPMAGVPKLAR